jgi:cytidylate kinase
MKLIIIHGPPAAGKLTVAKALSLRTYYKVFHNHLTIDCTEPVFEFGSREFWDINLRLRCEIIAEAARQQIDLVHTFCYAKGVDDENLRMLVSAARDNGGEVHVVYVNSRDEVRKKRISDESRVQIRKLTDPDSVDRQRREDVLFSTHPDFAESTLVLDTSDMTPDESATAIIETFGLEELRDE